MVLEDRTMAVGLEDRMVTPTAFFEQLHMQSKITKTIKNDIHSLPA